MKTDLSKMRTFGYARVKARSLGNELPTEGPFYGELWLTAER